MIGKAEFSVVTAVDEHAAVSTGRSLGAMTCKRTIATTRRLRDEIKFACSCSSGAGAGGGGRNVVVVECGVVVDGAPDAVACNTFVAAMPRSAATSMSAAAAAASAARAVASPASVSACENAANVKTA